MFLGLEPGVGAELVGGIPQARFSSVAVAASFSLGATQRMQSGPQTGRTVVPGHYG